MRNDIHLVETEQHIEIKDNLDQFRYRIEFKEFDHKGYRVEVIDMKTKVPTMLFSKTFMHKHEAMDVFEHKKHEYLIYVKSHMKDLEDINLYKEHINYREIDPDCCKNCAFCHKDHHGMHLECWNKENFVFQDYMKDECPNNRCGIHNRHPDHERMFLDVHPEVKPNGLCNNYVRFIPRPYPYHDCGCEHHHYNNMYDTFFEDHQCNCSRDNGNRHHEDQYINRR